MKEWLGMKLMPQQYIIALAEEGSITKAAKSLDISQPALSNWLRSVEKQYGTDFIIRSKRELIFTPAGKVYLDGARKMIEIKQKTYNEMASTSGYLKETIYISGTPNGGASVFSDIFTDFQDKYPSVSLQFIESYNNKCLELIENGVVDIGLCTVMDADSPVHEHIILHEKEQVLMIPSSHSLGYDASGYNYGADFPTINILQLGDTPFIMPGPEMSYYAELDNIFNRIGFKPRIIFQSANVKVIYEMVRNGNGAAVLPRRFFSPLDNVSPFSLKPKFMSFTAITYKKGRKLTEAQEYLVKLRINNDQKDLG